MRIRELKEEILNKKANHLFQNLEDIKTLLAKNVELSNKLCEEIRLLRNFLATFTVTKKENIAIFVDSQNLYYSAKMRYGAKVDYEKLLELITKGRNLVKAYAYIVQPPEGDVKPFATSLEHIGYIVKIKDVRTRADGSAKANWDMGIALDVLGMIDYVDTIVLASGDGDFVPLVEFVKNRHKRVEIFAFPENTAYDLKEKADRFEPLDERVIYNPITRE
ncbi:MAG: NYN domain-containing protein [candidate division WOR-3 bacterium]|nr:NYN domain-containing protein [candidate division WOR-3 bacterium]